MIKEINKQYKDKFKTLQKTLIKLHQHIKNKRNKYIINNYSIDFINKEVKNLLTSVNLGKYLFKFFYDYNKPNKNDDLSEEDFKKDMNILVTDVLNHIEKERFVEHILSVKISKKREVNYSVTL